MFGIKELKESIKVTEEKVDCPVKNCTKMVDRQRRIFKRDNRFKCPVHKIYISPSTFEYQSELDNLLWKDKDDLNLLEKIKKMKRESRIARDNSEDAVTWNVFRFLERNNLIENTLSSVLNITLKSSEVIYWSYSQTEETIWSELNKARKEFEINPKKGSEPDIIIKNNDVLIFIEAKLTANNNTTCKSNNLEVQKKYESGGKNWFSKVFKSNYKTIAIDKKKYELLRFWLLGTWISKELKLKFYLLNLVRENYEKKIERDFKNFIKVNKKHVFKRITWEDIYRQIKKSGFADENEDKKEELKYFENKVLGYRNGKLQRAFLI